MRQSSSKPGTRLGLNLGALTSVLAPMAWSALSSPGTANALFTFRQSLAAMRPVLVTERGKRLIAALEPEISTWHAAYSELERVSGAGNPSDAAIILSDRIVPLYSACVAALGTARPATSNLIRFAVEPRDGSREVMAGSGKIACSSQSSTTGITAITRKTADNTRTVAGLMEETTQRAGDANHNLEEMVIHERNR